MNVALRAAGCLGQDEAMAVQERLTLRNLYLYLVCLITLVISIFAAVSVVRTTVELLYPDPGYYALEPGSREPGLSETERQRREKAARESQRRQAVLGLVGSATMLLIAVPVYAYHWRRVQTELPSRSTPPSAGESPAG
jgi:hypothetical protein